MWELGVTALVAIGKATYDRFVGIRGLSKDFERDLDRKLKYFVDTVNEIHSASVDAIALFERLDGVHWDGGESVLRDIVHRYENMTRREAGMAAEKDTTFYKDNRGQIKKLKKQDREIIVIFYDEFETLAARTTRNCQDIDRLCREAKSALDRDFWTTEKARDAIHKITMIVVDIADDFDAFGKAMRDATSEGT